MGRDGLGEDFDAWAVQAVPRLRRFARACARDQHHADDLLQGTLERVFAAWPRIRSTDDALAYARTTLTRLLISEERRPWRRREVLHGDVPETPGADDATADRLDTLAAVRELPARQRAVVVLRFLEDQSVAQVAELLGCTEGTVKSQSHAALRTLRTRLEQASPEEALR